MAGYEKAMFALCEKCKQNFTTSLTLYNSVNTSIKHGICCDFLNDKLNVVTCPHCKSSFIYERPFVAFSTTKNYAIYSNQQITDNSVLYGKSHLYNMLKLDNMKFRLVTFQHEASEKSRIFESDLCDIKIEKIKRIYFDESYFKNKLDNFVVFKEISDDKIIFEYRDYLQNVLETKEVPMDEYNKITSDYIQSKSKYDIEWIRI